MLYTLAFRRAESLHASLHAGIQSIAVNVEAENPSAAEHHALWALNGGAVRWRTVSICEAQTEPVKDVPLCTCDFHNGFAHHAVQEWLCPIHGVVKRV